MGQRVLVALMLGSAAALAPVSVPSAQKHAVARRGFGNALLGGAAALIGTAANAYEGVYSMEIVKADDAVLDEDALRSGSVQGALNEFKSYAVGVVKLREVLSNDNQFDVGKVLKKEYDYVKVRATFNKLTPLWTRTCSAASTASCAAFFRISRRPRLPPSTTTRAYARRRSLRC